jgi:hypothetical protein
VPPFLPFRPAPASIPLVTQIVAFSSIPIPIKHEIV